MADRFNPFSNESLFLPLENYDLVNATLVVGKTAPIGIFPRLVDVWWASLVVGVAEGLSRSLEKRELREFVKGSVLAQDSWRIDYLQLLGIALSRSGEQVIMEPSSTMGLVHDYVFGGYLALVPHLLTADDPSWELSNRLLTLSESPLPRGPHEEDSRPTVA